MTHGTVAFILMYNKIKVLQGDALLKGALFTSLLFRGCCSGLSRQHCDHNDYIC